MYYRRGGLSIGVRGGDDLEMAQKLVQAMREEPELVEEVLGGTE